MNKLLLSIKRNWALIILFMLSVSAFPGIADDKQQCQWTPVSQSRFTEILTIIDRKVEENYNRIKTWQGKVAMVFDSVYEGDKVKEMYEEILADKPLPNKITDHVEVTKEFAVDVNKGLLYGSVYPDAQQEIIDEQTGKNLQLNKFVHIGSGKSIVAPDYQMDCRNTKNQDGVVVRRDVIKQSCPSGKLTCQSNLHPVFDPRDTMRIFGDITGKTSAPLGGAFARYLAFFNKEDGHSIDGHPTITVE